MIRLTLALGLILCLPPNLTPSLSASPAASLLKQLSKFAASQSAETTTKALSKEAGEALAKRVGNKLIQTGGEEAIQAAGKLVARGGANVLRALDNVADPTAMIKVLGELPSADVAAAAARLAAGQTGQQLAELSAKHGVKTLAAEVAHPGLAVKYVGQLGDEGATLATRLTTDQATAVAKHVDDIAELPPKLRSDLIEKIAAQPERFAAAMGRFVADNPGKILFTAASTAVILQTPETFLDGMMGTTLPDGTVVPGLLERSAAGIVDRTVTPVIKGLTAIFLVAVALLTAIGIYILLRRIRQPSGPDQNL